MACNVRYYNDDIFTPSRPSSAPRLQCEADSILLYIQFCSECGGRVSLHKQVQLFN